MAIARNSLTQGDEEHATSVGTTSVTASISPADDALVLLAVLAMRNDSINNPPVTVTGGGMAQWDLVGSIEFDLGGTGRESLSLFRAQEATPGTGTVTITGFVNDLARCWVAMEFTGCAIGNNGADAIYQLAVNQATGVFTSTATLDTLQTGSAVYACAGVNVVAGADPADFDILTGFTQTKEQPETNGGGFLIAAFDLSTPDITPTVDSALAADMGIFALEISETARAAPTSISVAQQILVTRATTTSATPVQVTGATLDATEIATAGIEPGDECILIVSAVHGGNAVNVNAFDLETRIGTTFALSSGVVNSFQTIEPNNSNAARGHEYFKLYRFTYADPQNIYLALNSNGTNTCRVDDCAVTLLSLRGLAPDDWRHAAVLHSGNAPAAFGTTGAAVTLPNDGDRWLLFAHTAWLVDSTAASMNMAIYDGTTDHAPLRWSGEDTVEQLTRGMVWGTAASTGLTWRVRFSASSGTDDCVRTEIFALRLDAFEDASLDLNPGISVSLTPLDTPVEGASIAAHPCTTDGDHFIAHMGVYDIGEAAKSGYFRTQIDGVTTPTSYGRAEIMSNSAVDEVGITGHLKTTLTAAGSPYLIDVDYHEGVDVSPAGVIDDSVLAAFSLKLAGAAPATAIRDMIGAGMIPVREIGGR